jgi:hypothetical protein
MNEHNAESLVDLVARRGNEMGNGVLSAVLAVTADLALAANRNHLAEALDEASDTARRGHAMLAVHMARTALAQWSFTPCATALSARVPEQWMLAEVDTNQQLKITLSYVDGPLNARVKHDERITMTLGEALDVLAAPAVGVRAMRLKSALESNHAVAQLLATRNAMVPEGTALVARLRYLAALSPSRNDGGYGRQVKQLADKLDSALSAPRTCVAELSTLIASAKQLAQSTRSGLARRVAYAAKYMVTNGIDETKALTEARAMVNTWVNTRIRANRLPLPAQNSILMTEPSPVRYAVVGAFDAHYCACKVEPTVEPTYLPDRTTWRAICRISARAAHPDLVRDWIPRWRAYAGMFHAMPTVCNPQDGRTATSPQDGRTATSTSTSITPTASTPTASTPTATLSVVVVNDRHRAICSCCGLAMPLRMELAVAKALQHNVVDCPNCGGCNKIL